MIAESRNHGGPKSRHSDVGEPCRAHRLFTTHGPLGAALMVLVLTAAESGAQALNRAPDTVTVVPSERYLKGPIHRFFLGAHYRTIWATGVRVPVLDLRTYAGGLTPTKKGGGQQTRSLRFDGADGRQYVFRTVDKDPSAALPENLRTPWSKRIYQDQTSAGLPAGPLMATPIVEAAGILQAAPTMVYLPDDALLGEFREEFGNLLGYIEERPRDGEPGGPNFANAEEIADSKMLFERLDSMPDVPLDATAFLTARLVDVYIGDWDRHRDNWKWALISEGGVRRWVPVPRDRDQAFIRFDGLALRAVRGRAPMLITFGPRYANIMGATWNGRDLDRRFLAGLEIDQWDSVAAVLKVKITDEVIDQAILAMPPEHRQLIGDELRVAMRARRDQLPEIARRYYLFLATHVDAHASDIPEVAIATKLNDSTVGVAIRRQNDTTTYFERRFVGRETKEVRIYLHGGADSGIIRGTGDPTVSIMIVGGGGDDTFVDETPGNGVGFYDDRGDNKATGRSIDTRRYDGIEDTAAIRPMARRDWGGSRGFFPVVRNAADRGLVLGIGHRITQYGFRRIPFKSRLEIRAMGAVSNGDLGADLRWTRYSENSTRFRELFAAASNLESLRWYGYGNETTINSNLSSDFYLTGQRLFSAFADVGTGIPRIGTLRAGLVWKYSMIDTTVPRHFVAIDQPLGSGNFAQLGARAVADLDTRDHDQFATGVRLFATAAGYPAILDAPAAFATVDGRVAGYLRLPMRLSPVLAATVGGKHVFGDLDEIPFYEAAFVGSWRQVRAFRSYRFAGESSLYGSAELRLQLASLPIFVPGKQGIYVFHDRARVYLDSQSSDEWHTSSGAGIWIGFRATPRIFTITYAESVEGTRIYIKSGFAF